MITRQKLLQGMRTPQKAWIFSLAGMLLASAGAWIEAWTLQEFCWGVWISGLGLTWACVISAGFQLVLTARRDQPVYAAKIADIGKIPPPLFLIGMTLLAVGLGYLAFYAYSYLYGFYGLFLSAFAEMEPLDYFGRDGFINSDFWSPVAWLFAQFWPLILATLIANTSLLTRSNPWRRFVAPLDGELLRIHILVVLMPFLALLAWSLLGEQYHTPTIIALMGVLFLLPKKPDDLKT
jgi:hypothetical protein